MSEWKPCPFCGHDEAIRDDSLRISVVGTVYCPHCGLEAPCDEWNNRPIEDALMAEILVLKAECFYAREKSADLTASLGKLVSISDEIVKHIRKYDFPQSTQKRITEYHKFIDRLLKELNNDPA